MAEEFQYNTVAYFGDSLTDNGNFYQLTSATMSISLPRDTFGYNQRYSDGLVYADYATQFLGAQTELNYAVTGARAIGDRSFMELVDKLNLDSFLVVPSSDPLLAQGIDLAGQVARFLEDTVGTDLSDVSATLTFGSNDYAEFKPWLVTDYLAESTAYVASIIGELKSAARDLHAAGVGQVVITGLPSAHFTPTYYETPYGTPMTSFALYYHNNQLERAVSALRSEGVNAVFVDMEAIGRAIARDPLNFGITAPLDEAYLLDTSGTDPVFNPVVEDVPLDQIAFVDGRHPTDAVHAMLGAFHAASLTNDVYIGNEFGNRKSFDDAQDLVMASGGSDRMALGGGDDIVFGEHGTDDLSGEAGNDILSGGSENDVVRGGDGDDVVSGGSGADVVLGDAGADVLLDGLGSDYVEGGAGDDLFIFHQASRIGGTDGVDQDTFDGGEGTDTLALLLDEATAAAYQADLLEFGEVAALANQGISAVNIEAVIILTETAELDQFNDLARLGEADFWGLV